MGELLIKPYEISVWEDKLTQDGFQEIKLAVIGSDTMSGPNKVYEPVFNKKANGEKTLSFSLKYKYFDPYSENEEVINPFAALLTNERKVKLKYEGKWYEFVVKDHTEASNEYTWTYTCTDAFVLELSKNGYNLEFSSDLNNNQGTARELGKAVLEDTDWRLGGVDIGKQLVEEPIYKATLLNTDKVTIINATGDQTSVPVAGARVYVFYSYIKNQNGKFVQFISQQDEYEIDSKNVITATNFRIQEELVFENNEFKFGNDVILQIEEVERLYKANRLVYNQLTTYDPVMERTVDRFKLGDREVYRYTNYTYTTSNVVINFVTNGENFNFLEEGTVQGWNPYVGRAGGLAPSDTNPIQKLELLTKPELKTGKPLADLAKLSAVEGYMKVHFNGALTRDYENALFNDGIHHNTSIIQSIAAGDEFLFRWRAGKGTIDSLTPVDNLRLIVAKYTQDAPTWGYYYKHIDPNNIILEFTPTQEHPLTVFNNIITGGEIRTVEGQQIYYIDDVAQTVSTKYIYESGGEQYSWNGESSVFEPVDDSYIPYYYLVAKAKRSVPNMVLTDPTEKIGIFVYVVGDNAAGDYFLQDVQLTRYIKDANNNPVTIGNIPTATSNFTEYYYLKPVIGSDADDINLYTSPDELKEAIGEEEADLQPLYNTNSEKNLSISASRSNCFNILQSIAETFECWIDLVVEHTDTGAIATDEDGPRKYVYLNEYAGKDNWAGFKYAINVESIERNVNSEEVVTKLIVDQSQSEYVDEGYISIANAKSNPSGESYILNFDYYYSQNLLDREQAELDISELTTTISEINADLQEQENKRRELEAALVKLEGERNVFVELVSTAQERQSQALADFQELTGESYEDYKLKHDELIIPTGDEATDEANRNQQKTEEETLLDVLGEIYASSATINNYSGIASQKEQEYWEKRRELRGNENYRVNVWVDRDELDERHIFVELNDYLPNFSFQLDGSTYTSTVSVKYFDIVSDGTQITFNPPQAPTQYKIDGQDSYTYTINDNRVAKFKITCDKTTPGIEDKIDELIEEKKENLKTFENKYRRFIQEGTWNSTDYIDSELYYLDALQVSNTSAFPAISYTINVVEISQLEGYQDYLFDAGDKTYIEDTEFFGWANQDGVLTPAREEVIVSEVEWHLDEPDKNIITVQNYKTRFEDFFQRVSAAVQTVQYNEATYAKISSLMDANGTINQDVLLESLNRVAGKQYNLTSDGSVLINGDHILVQNLQNKANRVIINSEGIRISSDGGQSWTTAIDGRGINIGTVYTGKLNTDNVIIGSDDNPSFRWDKSGISAYKSGQDGIYDLQTYVRYDEYGLYGIKEGGTFKATSLEDVKDKAHFAVTWDGFFIKNSYPGGGRVEITSDNDFRVMNIPEGQIEEQEKIKIGALEWGDGITSPDAPGATEAPTLYGIRIKNNAGAEVMKTDDEGNITITGTINANAGNIGGMTVNQTTLRMNHTVFERGVGIYSDLQTEDNEPMFIISDANGNATFNNINARGHIEAQTGTLGDLDVIDTITVGANGAIESSNYSVNDGWHIDNDQAVFNNARVRGEINAGSGNFYGNVTIGKDNEQDPDYILIDGTNALMRSSNYQDGAGYGWMINKDGDAVFNNITARGAIKTAVFEYAEIQAVGGIFIFRPSSTIRTAEINGNDLILTLEKPHLFQVGDWCKISNYLNENQTDDARINNILLTNGLTHVYEVVEANGKVVKLSGAAAMVQGAHAVTDLASLEGGALIDMGNKANGDGEVGTSNYGIGVNSSDNTVNLPRRAISLFETVIDETKEPKVSYKYRGILGTLPTLSATDVNDSIYNQNMAGTQGIYTDNMYLGDNNQYIAFYEDEHGKQLKIKASQIMFEITDDQGQGTGEYKDVTEATEGADGEDAITVRIDSSAGNVFLNKQIQTTLTCTVIKGNGTDITNQVTRFTWIKQNADGTVDSSWSRPLAGRSITLTDADVNSKAIFVCEVEF